MADDFRALDRDTPMLLPPSIQEWLPEQHLARFVVELVEQLDLSEITSRYGGSGGRRAYHPILLLATTTGGARWPAALPLLALIPALRLNARLRATPAGPGLNSLLGSTAQVLLLQALLLLAGAAATALLTAPRSVS